MPSDHPAKTHTPTPRSRPLYHYLVGAALTAALALVLLSTRTSYVFPLSPSSLDFGFGLNVPEIFKSNKMQGKKHVGYFVSLFPSGTFTG